MKYLRVKNWQDFQHYKDRCPPWIKLHRDLLRDYEFNCLQDASKLHLILIWLLASQLENKIPADPEFIKNQTGIKGKINLKELIDKGFLIDDSNALADCKQSARQETETETETETESIIEVNKNRFDDFWERYGKIGNKQSALKVYNKLIKEGVSHEKIISGLDRYQAQCRANKTEPRYIKHASTWLNAKGWEDEYPIYKQSTKASGLKDSLRSYANEPQKFDPWELSASKGVND
jgi:hypothetical protein